MTKKNGYLGLVLILILNLILSINTITAKAASATIKLSTDSKVVTKGNTITVSLRVDTKEAIGEIEGYLSYDSDILEFVGADKSISGGDGVLRVAETSDENPVSKKTYNMKFKAKEVGVGEIAFSDKPFVYNYDNGKEMSVSNNQISINVKTTKLLSTETSLSELKISPGELTPKFDSYVYEYSALVGSNVSSLVISANAKNQNASIKVKGNNDLKEGKNTIILTVKAESGDTKDYAIYVEKEAVKTENGNDSKEPKEKFSVVTDDGRTYIENQYRYEIVDLPEDVPVPEGYSETKLILHGVNVAAYTKSDDFENDFILIYAMNEEGESGFYQYDRVEQTMQRYMDTVVTDADTEDEEETKVEQSDGKTTGFIIAIVILSIISILLILGIIRLYMKNKGYHNDELDE